MDADNKHKLRGFLKDTLAQHGDHADFADGDSLFVSGRLDSFSMMNLVVYLEQAFALDFSAFEFDVGLIDSVNDIQALVASMQKAA